MSQKTAEALKKHNQQLFLYNARIGSPKMINKILQSSALFEFSVDFQPDSLLMLGALKHFVFFAELQKL